MRDTNVDTFVNYLENGVPSDINGFHKSIDHRHYKLYMYIQVYGMRYLAPDKHFNSLRERAIQSVKIPKLISLARVLIMLTSVIVM